MSPSRHVYTPGAGLPLAPPVGLDRQRPSAQVSGPWDASTGTNTHPDVEAIRVGARALARLAEQLSSRDREVLERVAEHRYVSTHQLQRFVFTGHASEASAARTARRVLLRLERTGLLRSLARRVGGVRAGSAATVWQLAPAGARLLRDEGTTFRTHEPSPRFLAHCLAVADVHLLLRVHAAHEAIEKVAVQVEPAAWRRYTGPGGEGRWLQPDLAAVVSSRDFADRWFIEVDLGTESLPTLLRKCGAYEAYRASGTEQAEHRVFPLVLWLFTDPARGDRLRRAVARSPRLTPALYRYADPSTLAQVLAGGDS